MTAAELLQGAVAAGLTLVAERDGIRVRGPQPARAHWNLALAPVTREIGELLKACTIGRGLEDPCPVCHHIHGSLADLMPCSECGAVDWRMALVDDKGRRTCRACLNGAGR